MWQIIERGWELSEIHHIDVFSICMSGLHLYTPNMNSSSKLFVPRNVGGGGEGEGAVTSVSPPEVDMVVMKDAL